MDTEQANLATAEQMVGTLNIKDGTTSAKGLGDGDGPLSITMDNLFNNDKIVSKLLEFLGFNDLLNVRLVNHLWNRNVVKYLNENSAMVLTQRNIFGYTALVENLNTLPRLCKKFRIRIEGEPGQKEFDSTLDCIIKLALICGKDSVESLQLNGNLPSQTLLYLNMQKMSELLQSISAGLTYLHLGELLLLLNNSNNSSSEPAESADISYLSFPELRSLYYGIGIGNTTLFAQILNTAPQLKALAATRNITEFYMGVYKIPGHVPKLEGVQSVSPTLEEMKIDLFHDETFNGLKHIRFEGLRKLHFVLLYDLPDTVKTEFAQFLETKCPQLRWLEFTLQLNTHGNPLGVIFPNPKYFPTLPNLTTFGYSINLKGGAHIGLVNINGLKDNLPTLAEKLPGLREVSTNFALQLIAPNAAAEPPPRATAGKGYCYNNPSMLNFVQFPQVETLYYKLARDDIALDRHTIPSPMGCCGTSIVENINQLHVLYPNVNKLVIFNDMLHSKADDTRFIILLLIQELGSKLKELQIFNYTEDWLKKLLRDKRMVDNLQELRTLKIIGDKRLHVDNPNLNQLILLTSLSYSPMDIEQLIKQTEEDAKKPGMGRSNSQRLEAGDHANSNTANEPLAFNLEYLMKRLPKLEVLVVSYDLLLVQQSEGRNNSDLEVEIVLAKYKNLYPGLEIQIL